MWSRVAASLMRATTAMHVNDKVRIECFVDDPLIALGGPKGARDLMLLRIIVLWMALGYKLSWKKGAEAEALSGSARS